MWRERERMEEKVKGKGSTNGRYKIDREDVKNSIGHEETKELICMIHGHKLSGGRECWWEGRCRAEGNKVEKKWDDCNSIIKKYI